MSDNNSSNKQDIRAGLSSRVSRGSGRAGAWVKRGRVLRELMPILILATAILGAARARGMDFTGDGRPDILWQHKGTGQNEVWVKGPIDGLLSFSKAALPTNSDPRWRMAGAGFFDGDAHPDILWQHATGSLVVWFMDKTTLKSTGMLNYLGAPGWQLMVVGDLDGNGSADLVWQHERSGEKLVWLMRGLQFLREAIIDGSSGRVWRISAAGDFNQDGKTDLVIRNLETGAVAIWLMDGGRIQTGVLVSSNAGRLMNVLDQDYQLAQASDFNGDGQTDLLWRHATLGLNAVWYMRGTTFLRSVAVTSEFETDWRIATQPLEESQWRLEPVYGPQWSVAAHATPPVLTLKANVDLEAGQTMRVKKRSAPDITWDPVTDGGAGTGTFLDTDVRDGVLYQYEMTLGLGDEASKLSVGSSAIVSAAVNFPALEKRGRIVLLVDRELSDRFFAALSDALDLLEQDLTGDGWRVHRHYVPRHLDDATDEANQVNRRNLANIKNLIRAEAAAGELKGVMLIGHVTIPYSGHFAPDGHGLHSGAWPADLYYGDLDGKWTDEINNLGNDFLDAVQRNAIGDGKFDQEYLPSEAELFVGRVDFARLGVFGTGNAPQETELALLAQYFKKTRAYRHKTMPNPPAHRGAVYGFFGEGDRASTLDSNVYENAKRNVAAFYEDGLGALAVADPFLQPKKSYQWCFLGGYGRADLINENLFSLRHTSADLKAGLEPRVGFYVLLGSFFGDWNTWDNLLRACLATPQYGLASLWLSPSPSWDPTTWRFEEMGLGKTLGEGLLATVNGTRMESGDNSRVLGIMGDPTLRLHTVAPPRGLSVDTFDNVARLVWNAGEEGCSFAVYKASSLSGPFERLNEAPLTSTFFLDRNRGEGKPVYMVRSLKPQASGRGTYINISQGTFGAVK